MLKKLKKNYLWISTCFILVLGFWAVSAYILAKSLEVEKSLARADAILVLSGSSDYMERTSTAANLYKVGIAQKIFLTNDGLQGGWDQEKHRNPYFAERARWELIQRGVPEESIEILLPVVDGTDDEANLFVNLAAEKNVKSLMLVTSSYHSYRALWTFEKIVKKNNLPVEIGIKAAQRGKQTPSPLVWWLSYRGWKMVGLEYIKIVYYRMFY